MWTRLPLHLLPCFVHSLCKFLLDQMLSSISILYTFNDMLTFHSSHNLEALKFWCEEKLLWHYGSKIIGAQQRDLCSMWERQEVQTAQGITVSKGAHSLTSGCHFYHFSSTSEDILNLICLHPSDSAGVTSGTDVVFCSFAILSFEYSLCTRAHHW